MMFVDISHIDKNTKLDLNDHHRQQILNHRTFIFFKREKNPHSWVKSCEKGMG